MKKGLLVLVAIIGFFSLVLLQIGVVPTMARAQEGDDEGPTFNNPAQAAHAENLANAVAKNDPDVQKAFDALEEAETALAAANKSGEKEAIATAQKAYDAALANAQAALTKAAGAPTEDIAAMRAQGMGWGQIAHELGVHPGTLGLGHSKEVSATERDSKTGLAMGHSMTAGNENAGGKGSGNAYAYGHNKDADGGGGAGHGGGNGGGHGGGNGGGGGGGGGHGK